MEINPGKQLWQLMVEKLAESKQNPVLKYRCFEQLVHLLINSVHIFEEGIKSRASPSTPLFGMVINSSVRLYGTVDFFWAGIPNADIMEKDGPRVYIDQKDANDSIISVGRGLAQELINATMEQATKELAIFWKEIQDTRKIPFDFVNQKFHDLAAKAHFDLQEVPGGANLILDQVKSPKLCFEDILEWQIYIFPMLSGQGNLWLNARNCDSCGKFFFYERSTAKFCSDACRMAKAYKHRRSK